MSLILLILIPALTAAAILGAPERLSRTMALAGASVQLILSFWLLFAFNNATPAESGYALGTRTSWFAPLNIDFYTGVDGIAVAMILLTAVVVFAGVLVSWNVTYRAKEFFFLLVLLSLGAYGFFISLDLFMMFFFLEIAVIPKYLLIGIWGSGKKEYAATKLVLMLMGASALIFVGLLGIYYNTPGGINSFDLAKLTNMEIPKDVQLTFFPFLFAGFGVFTALFPFHTWVPDGHSSAPTAASMFLAGISMKLGGFGCLRVAAMMPEAAQHYSWIILVLAAVAILYGAFATMMQTDLKYMNAYSSISHCGFVLLGIGMLTKSALMGAAIQMVSHGLMTALFFAAIGMLYERTHTRKISELGGVMKVMPFISSAFFIAGLCSLGLPGLSGFVAEMTIFIGSWELADSFYRIITIVACMSIVVTAVYILRATGFSLMGPVKKEEYHRLTDARWNEKIAAGVLIAGILAIGIAPFWLTELLDPGDGQIMQMVNRMISLTGK